MTKHGMTHVIAHDMHMNEMTWHCCSATFDMSTWSKYPHYQLVRCVGPQFTEPKSGATVAIGHDSLTLIMKQSPNSNCTFHCNPASQVERISFTPITTMNIILVYSVRNYTCHTALTLMSVHVDSEPE